jgi:HK97 gp10 family phage protein
MRFELNIADVVRLENALKAYEGDAEKALNDVLHNQAGELIQDEVKLLMPVSGRKWNGKKAPAKTSKSLKQIEGNLSVTETTTNSYHYLYFPDDGTNTQRHVGNQQFFLRGAENKKEEIIDLCVGRLVNSFENAIN